MKSLDISHVCQISNYPGVSRTVTGLLFMILDLHLRLPCLQKDLIWFNGNKCHLTFQFSDGGAPETSELGISIIGSLTCWNFGSRVRSREFHYLLHFLSVSEKDAVMEDLWKQHTEERFSKVMSWLFVASNAPLNFSQVLISLGKAGQIMSSTKQPHTLHPMPMSTKGSCVKWGNHREFQWMYMARTKWGEMAGSPQKTQWIWKNFASSSKPFTTPL